MILFFLTEALSKASCSVWFEYFGLGRNLQLYERTFEKLSKESPCKAFHNLALCLSIIENNQQTVVLEASVIVDIEKNLKLEQVS